VPALVLGGAANALSVVRSLGRAGVPVWVLAAPDCPARHSRYARTVPFDDADKPEESWADFLLSPQSESLRGAVLLPCCDPALDLVARHHDELAAKFRLDEVNPQARVAMLDKVRIYQTAAAAGVATPRFWILRPGQDLHELRAELPYPLIVKPSHTHVFRQHFGTKFVIAPDFDGLQEAYRLVRGLGIATMLVEFVPGLDDRLCSYYSYLDGSGAPLFHFTKRVVRRYPAVTGNGCYHMTDWDPEVAAAGLAFLRAARVRGLGNVEFKRDPRDGRLKLIECNARLTEANCLVAAAGLDLALFVYNRLTGRPPVPVAHYRRGLRLWYPVEDYHAFRQLRREGKLSWGQWLRSIAHPQTLPFFRWSDPWPSVAREFRRLKDTLGRRLRRLLGREPVK
jgi:predicted ATP-grasp superfamily ATP-dependent carboligase